MRKKPSSRSLGYPGRSFGECWGKRSLKSDLICIAMQLTFAVLSGALLGFLVAMIGLMLLPLVSLMS